MSCTFSFQVVFRFISEISYFDRSDGRDEDVDEDDDEDGDEDDDEDGDDNDISQIFLHLYVFSSSLDTFYCTKFDNDEHGDDDD